MIHPRLATIKECTGCMVCVDSCKHKAIKHSLGDDGHFYISIDNDLCVGCGICTRVCPVISQFPYSQNGESVFYAAWSKDLVLRQKSASGGTFAAMASYVIAKQGIVFGAANIGVCDVRHIYVDCKKNLYKLQGSKYTPSDATESYEQAYSFLKVGKCVLFSGTGCQIAGLLSFLKNKRYSGKLLTVDLICGGIPSRLLVQKFIENEPYKVKKILSFRSKENGWKSSGFLYNITSVS